MIEWDHERGDQFWIWIIAAALGIILFWEGLKSMIRPLICALFTATSAGINSGQWEDKYLCPSFGFWGFSVDPNIRKIQLWGLFARSISMERGPIPIQPISSSNISPAPEPRNHPPHTIPQFLSVPHNPPSHFIASGTDNSIKNSIGGDIRNRISSQYLPCRNCTIGRPMVVPPAEPAAQAPIIRRRSRYG